jgi:hypothetical protein
MPAPTVPTVASRQGASSRRKRSEIENASGKKSGRKIRLPRNLRSARPRQEARLSIRARAWGRRPGEVWSGAGKEEEEE